MYGTMPLVFAIAVAGVAGCRGADEREKPGADETREDRTDRAFDVDRPGDVERRGDVAPGEAPDAYPEDRPATEPSAPSAAPGLEGDEDAAPTIEPVGPGEAAGGGAGRSD